METVPRLNAMDGPNTERWRVEVQLQPRIFSYIDVGNESCMMYLVYASFGSISLLIIVDIDIPHLDVSRCDINCWAEYIQRDGGPRHNVAYLLVHRCN